ncbi:MAG: hypothetical protein WC622_13600 [Pedobacter sp.]|jgi:hypothetical protein|uniref:hypothetical protein n=1 Tax=Pedobacter sp. TaxID=1411316 RepID=UPI003562A67D
MKYISSFGKLTIIVLILFTACSPKISKLVPYNRYIKGFNIHIYNDSLSLYFNSPADITYANTSSAIKKKLKSSRFKSKNAILFYGTTTDPAYHVVITIGNQQESKSSRKVIVDTILNGISLHFIGLSDPNAQIALKSDLDRMVKSLKIGEGYAEHNNTVMDVVNGAMKSNHFYQTLSEIKQFPIPKNQGNSFELQMQLTYGSFLANNPDYTKLLAQQESTIQLNTNLIDVIKNGNLGNDQAFEKIVQMAKAKRLVMINENHFYPNHRIFIINLLKQLKAVGYNYLALEALSSDTVLNQYNAYPILATGFYTREQHYGNLLRTAKQLGYNFVSYEHMGINKDREIKQADNLYEKTFAKDKNAKVLVIAGIDHILEQADNTGKKWMAQLLFEKYNIDPLTISQTHLNLYRKFSPFTYQIINYDKFKDIGEVANVDLFLLNNKIEDWSDWPNKFNYRNQHDETVQVSLFYQKELNNSSAYQSAIPYFTCLIPAKQTYQLPLVANEDSYLVVYNKLGQVLAKEMLKDGHH